MECSDDSFDGGAYFLSRFDSSDDAVVCLDQNLRVGRSNIPSAGQGLFAKKTLSSGSRVISTPLIPIHRSEMEIEDPDVNSKQLMLNYAYGHPGSDLLLLPYGPLVNYFNHGKQANVAVRWHVVPPQQKTLHRREEHHHPELFAWSAEQVALTHGKGLVMDIVALREIQKGEEVVLDYGAGWREAWDAHVASWKTESGDEDYVDAEEYGQLHGDEVIRTEIEQEASPYPENLETFCFYALHLQKQEKTALQYYSWDDDGRHECFRPCRVLERYPNRKANTKQGMFYTIELKVLHNRRVIEECVIDSDTIVTDVPQSAVRVVNRPYTTDVFLKKAFRHEIGVPDGFYPSTWMKQKLRRQPSTKGDNGDEFKTEKVGGYYYTRCGRWESEGGRCKLRPHEV